VSYGPGNTVVPDMHMTCLLL